MRRNRVVMQGAVIFTTLFGHLVTSSLMEAVESFVFVFPSRSQLCLFTFLYIYEACFFSCLSLIFADRRYFLSKTDFSHYCCSWWRRHNNVRKSAYIYIIVVCFSHLCVLPSYCDFAFFAGYTCRRMWNFLLLRLLHRLNVGCLEGRLMVWYCYPILFSNNCRWWLLIPGQAASRLTKETINFPAIFRPKHTSNE